MKLHFYDGEIAYNNITTYSYDLYIRYKYSFIDGLEILKINKKYKRKIKVIMISANMNIEKIKEAYKYGCDDYLKSP